MKTDYTLALRMNSFVAAWALAELAKVNPEKAKEIIQEVNRKYRRERVRK